jgi:RNA polymerase sigma factor (sigma-70 family)
MPSSLGHGEGADRHDDSSRLTELLLEWQAVGEPECFERIVAILSPIALHSAGRMLARAGLRSRSLCDDVLSLVLDHLRRLYEPATHAVRVARFTAEPDGSDDAGLRYVVWLTLARTRDVIRIERRRKARQASFTDLDLVDSIAVARGVSPKLSYADDSWPLTDLRAAIASLDGADRDVVDMLLAGRTQKEIADALGVCEGTVSRRKDRAILRIRDVVLTTVAQRQAEESAEHGS